MASKFKRIVGSFCYNPYCVESEETQKSLYNMELDYFYKELARLKKVCAEPHRFHLRAARVYLQNSPFHAEYRFIMAIYHSILGFLKIGKYGI